MLYQVEWLSKHRVIERGHLSAKKVPEAVAVATAQSIDIRARLRLLEPDSFRLMDENGNELGVFLIDEQTPGHGAVSEKSPKIPPLAWPAC